MIALGLIDRQADGLVPAGGGSNRYPQVQATLFEMPTVGPVARQASSARPSG